MEPICKKKKQSNYSTSISFSFDSFCNDKSREMHSFLNIPKDEWKLNQLIRDQQQNTNQQIRIIKKTLFRMWSLTPYEGAELERDKFVSFPFIVM